MRHLKLLSSFIEQAKLTCLLSPVSDPVGNINEGLQSSCITRLKIKDISLEPNSEKRSKLNDYLLYM